MSEWSGSPGGSARGVGGRLRTGTQSPQIFYELAVAHAANSDRKRALAALRKAFELGFKDTAALEREPALEPLRGESEYKRLVESLKQGQ